MSNRTTPRVSSPRSPLLWGRGALALSSLLVAAVVVAAPAAADWLVLTDGSQVETRGEWEERGRLIVFSDAKGTLTSLRVSDVDLEASVEFTAEMVRRAEEEATEPEEEPERREAVFRITDADVAHREPAPLGTAGEEGSGEEAGTEAAPASAAPNLRITGWEENTERTAPGLEFLGTIENPGPTIASNVVLRVVLLDENEEEVDQVRAVLSQPSILPEEVVSFRAVFTDTFGFADVRFDLQSRPLRIKAPPDDVPDQPSSGDEPPDG